MRKEHILEAGGKEEYPERLVFYDSESHVQTKITDEEIEIMLNTEIKNKLVKPHSLYLITSIFRNSKERYKKTYRIDKEQNINYKFWNDVIDYTIFKKTTYVYAHNAKYDTLVTQAIPSILKHGYEVAAFSDSNPFFITFRKYFPYKKNGEKYGKVVYEEPKQKEYTSVELIPEYLGDGRWFVPKPRFKEIQLLSSTNIYQTSLKKLGEVFNLPKLDFNHDDEFNYDDAEVYGMRDTEILEKAMISWFYFVNENKLGGFSITSAGQAFKAYRRRFLDKQIFIHNDINALRVERLAYCGGRTEVFRMGKVKNAVYIDYNSMYPASMKEYKYPTKLISFKKRMKLNDLRKAIDHGYLVCAECYINTDEPVYPKKDKRLIFPIGQFKTALCTEEIKYAMKHGHLISVRNVCLYECDDIFSLYVDYFYTNRLQAKKEGNSVMDFLFKLLLNCLYGKYGQTNEVSKVVGFADPDVISIEHHYCPINGFKQQKIFGGKIWEVDESIDAQEAYNSFPAIAAHVTSNARMKLWQALKTVGKDERYYCDTDSIMCSRLGYQKLLDAGIIHESQLGKMKIEKEGDAEFFGGKDYIFDDGKKTDVKIKGVSKSAIEVEEDEQGRKRFITTQWGGLSKFLEEGQFTTYENKIVMKTLQRKYTKGIVKENGVVEPFVLQEDIFNQQYDSIVYQLLNYSIKTPLDNYKYIKLYSKLPRKIKTVFFRDSARFSIKEVAEFMNMTEKEFLDLLLTIKI